MADPREHKLSKVGSARDSALFFTPLTPPSFQNNPGCNIVQRHKVQYKTETSVAVGLKQNHGQILKEYCEGCSQESQKRPIRSTYKEYNRIP